MSWEFALIGGPYGGTAEGPAWDGSGLLFTHIPSSRILRYDPGSGASAEFKAGTNNANGLMFDSEGRLYACEGGARRVVRYEEDGSAAVLADGFEGQRLNIPNDLAIDLLGRVWFTDPYYEGAGGPWSDDRAHKDLDYDSVLPAGPADRRVVEHQPSHLRHHPPQRALVLVGPPGAVRGTERAQSRGEARAARLPRSGRWWSWQIHPPSRFRRPPGH